MKFKEIANRLSGFSTPIYGVQWTPAELEVQKARRVIAFLEDKRVLYNPNELEVPERCVHSIIEIRKFLTSELGGIDSNVELAKNLRAMRAACRKFLDSISGSEREIVRFARRQGDWASWKFYSELGLLRGVFGVHVAQIATAYGLDVEDELASILPNLDEYEEGNITKLNLP